MSKWLTSKEFREKYRLSPSTLWRRVNVGHTVKTKKLFGTLYYLDEDDDSKEESSENTMNVIYCRVSNTKQKNDLLRQEQILREYCVKNGVKPDAVFTDIASGMREDRNGLRELIELVKEYKVNKVYISYKDRLTRFGYGYFEHLFSLYGTQIEVVNLTKEEDFQQELTQDFISILHYFSMKMYSNRRKQLKTLENELVKENEISASEDEDK